jgi:hypothetical protein
VEIILQRLSTDKLKQKDLGAYRVIFKQNVAPFILDIEEEAKD